MTADRRKSPWPSLVWGATLLAAGLIFWFDRLGRIEAVEYFRWWPLVLIATGLAEIPARRWGSALLWVIIGGFFLLPKFGLALQPWRLLAFWHLFISAAGIALIAQALRRPAKQSRGETFRSVAVMGADTRTVRSANFAGGEAVVVMAGSLIDIAPGRAPLSDVVLDVLAFWGGIEIQIPPGWQVVNEVTALLGGFDDKTAAGVPNAPRIVIRGAAIMGGIEVRNPREARSL